MPQTNTSPKLPKHIAIVMDGNGRWARRKHLPHIAGHRAGVKTVQEVIKQVAERGIEVLSLFAFSSENWQRPKREVSALMDLFLRAIKKEIMAIHENQIRLRFIGDLSLFSQKLRHAMHEAEQLTQSNTGLQLVIAVNYGGRWDIVSAVRKIARDVLAGEIAQAEINESLLKTYLSVADIPEPDLFIRTSGELRISNFFLWQLAYAELYFTDVLWPDFTHEHLDAALQAFSKRQRRFGSRRP